MLKNLEQIIILSIIYADRLLIFEGNSPSSGTIYSPDVLHLKFSFLRLSECLQVIEKCIKD